MSFSKFGQGRDIGEWSQKLHDIMDEMTKRSFVAYRDKDTWQPATDVYETRADYFICFELAGTNPDTVEIECLDQHRLRISGYRGNPRPEGESSPLSVHVMEIDHGPFRREVDLPEPVDIAAVEATYDKGFLWVRLPKSMTS